MAEQYDDSQLRKLFAEMTPKQRAKALRGAFRREAASVRKAAVANLRSRVKHPTQRPAKFVRASVFKRGLGFSVTVRPKKAGGRIDPKELHAVWLEEGTVMRRTKTATKVWTRKRKAHNTGKVKSRKFMRDTRVQVKGRVTENLKDEIANSVIKTAKKYGCI